VFNINNQEKDWKFVIVSEGPFDAMSVDGVAVLNNEVNETQADIIESLGREVIVVADRDRAGSKMLNSAMEYGWSASFPVWQETCKDINEAVVKYGKLFVLKAILDAKETSKLKIELMRKKLYN
jgi:5S rRNA maturation endonuclease (ribonuclease M5)